MSQKTLWMRCTHKDARRLIAGVKRVNMLCPVIFRIHKKFESLFREGLMQGMKVILTQEQNDFRITNVPHGSYKTLVCFQFVLSESFWIWRCDELLLPLFALARIFRLQGLITVDST